MTSQWHSIRSSSSSNRTSVFQELGYKRTIRRWCDGTKLAIYSSQLKSPCRTTSKGRSASCTHPASSSRWSIWRCLDCVFWPGRSASSPLASSARWSRPRPLCGLQAGWRVGSQGRRGRLAKPWTPLSSALLSTWENQKICKGKYGLKNCLNEIIFLYSLPYLLSPLPCFVHNFTSLFKSAEIFD